MAKKNQPATEKPTRRTFTDEFKREAVQMMLDGLSASSVAKNLGIGNTNLLYRWKAELISRAGPATAALDDRILETSNRVKAALIRRDPSHRSRRPIRIEGVSQVTGTRTAAAEHEPRW